MTRKRRRLVAVGLVVLGVGTATALALTAFQDNLVFFFSPSDVIAGKPPEGRAFRLGGLVEQGSVERVAEGRAIKFRVTDTQKSIDVVYAGVVPDLFREGQGVVAQGRLEPDGTFRASDVLAKHDETYMPREVADALKRAGHWQEQPGAKK